MSAWGWPEPSTGMTLVRVHASHSWRSRLSWLSSRIAFSRYFSLISLSVEGIADSFFDAPRGPPLSEVPMNQPLLDARFAPRWRCLPPLTARAPDTERFAALGRPVVCRNLSAW